MGSNGTLGYSVCVLNKLGMSSKYRDPYLLAIFRDSDASDAVADPWFSGYETEPRWMHMTKSGTGIQCVDEGFALLPPATSPHAETFLQVCADHGVGVDHVLRVPQVERGGRRLDIRDRVQLGAALLRDFVKAGLSLWYPTTAGACAS